jgi:TusA-related sulfurtransferase
MTMKFKPAASLHCEPVINEHPANLAKDVKEVKVGDNGETGDVGKAFLKALAEQDFGRLESLYTPELRFRAIVPSGERLGQTPAEAVQWFRRWFGAADSLQMIESDAHPVFGRQYLSYQLRLHDAANGWRVIEQQVYYNVDVQRGQINDMWLACSGFFADPLHTSLETGPDKIQAPQPVLGGDIFYDAGSKGCAEGPLDDISSLIRPLAAGKTLEIHATDPSVSADLSAWCRLSGHTLLKHAGDHFLIQHK